MTLLLALGCVAAQIGYPLSHGGTRDWLTVAVVGFGAAAALSHAAATRGVRFAAAFGATTAGIGLVAEAVGTETGFPFGCYDYAVGRLGPDLAGVPLVIPLAWTAGSYPVFVVATLVWRRRATRIAAIATAMTGWDLYLDPQMVADGQWSWCAAGPTLPGLGPLAIPYSNYLGWLIVTAVMATVILALADRARPATGSPAVPVGLFCWTWLGSAVAHGLLLGNPNLHWSALYGLVGMGTLGVPLLLAWSRRRSIRRTDMAR
ncbi:carotenoid biosynthesis protein [Skermania piniformis]|uniref:carotenoid biosynthesis protein n=1 Tax=Skermania pinensis TaxID=39122 RepID=UPI000A863CDE|nr:carotenoid biosynthesis protein [Skermania piniformis]